MALEDAHLLGSLLSHLSSLSQLPPFLDAFEQLRKERTTKTQLSSRLNQKIFHLQDGVEQRRRDWWMSGAMQKADWEETVPEAGWLLSPLAARQY
jgi:salicylate hydroxylase